MNEFELEKWCSMLDSAKITQRKQACDELQEVLERRSTLDFLNSDGNKWWHRIHNSIVNCLSLDHDKRLVDLRKKGNVYQRSPSTGLWILFYRLAVKYPNSLDFLQVFRFIHTWLQDPTKKQLHPTCLKVLTQYFLSNTYIKYLLEENDWRLLYSTLKFLCKDTIETDQIECLSLITKLGPLHNFPVSVFREQFVFITKLSQRITLKSPKQQQHAMVEQLLYFCHYTAQDNRMACCKLGEEVFLNLLELYQGNANDDKMKANLIEFFLLQVAIHNPKGAKEEHCVSYAFSWSCWKRFLFNLYDILTFEIDANLNLNIKNGCIFIHTNGINELFESYTQLFVEVCNQLFGHETSSDLSGEPPSKRSKMDFNISSLNDKIIETKFWAWLNLTYPLIETYPNIVTTKDYINLLKTLSSLQAECKQPDLLHHIYKALIILQKIEGLIDVERGQVEELWKRVVESTLRSANQKDENIQTLLQLLMTNKYLVGYESLLQYFRPEGAFNMNQSNLTTLEVTFKSFLVLQSNKSVKKQAISWILASNPSSFLHFKPAEMLIFLTLKQWPKIKEISTRNLKRPFADIEETYFNVCFQQLLVEIEDQQQMEWSDTFCLDQGLLSDLIVLLQTLMDQYVQKSTHDFLYISILIFNVLSCLHTYKLMEINTLISLSLYRNFINNLQNKFSNLKFDTEIKEKDCQKIADTLIVLFSWKTSDHMSTTLRQLIPESLIMSMFQILNSYKEGKHFFEFKNSILKCLVTFSCLADSSPLLIQERALQALLSFKYDYSNDQDYDLVLTLFKAFLACGPKCLSEKNLELFYNVLQKFCEVRHYCYTSVCEFLDFFHSFLSVVVASVSVECKSQFIAILNPFYCNRMSYGSAVSVKLLNCLSLLFELDPEGECSEWSGEKIVLKILDFLYSDYQKVRFAAIKALVAFFKASSKKRLLKIYHQQEILLTGVSDIIPKVLEINGNPSEDRLVDELVARSSSIFHTFASIILASNLWIEEALFGLLKIVCDKKLDLSQLQIVIAMVAKKLGFKSSLKFLEKYLVGLVNRWQSYDFDVFPFAIFNCSSKMEFYSKYWVLISHIFVLHSENKLNEVALAQRKTSHSLIEDSCPKLLSYCICQEVLNLSEIDKNVIYILLRDTLGIPKLQEIARDNMEEIILCLTECVCDEKEFERSFGQFVFFPKVTDSRLSVREFEDCLDFLETTLFNGQSITSHLIQNNPEKIHFILLQLNLRLNDVQTTEDKLRYFHLYSLIATLSIKSVITEPTMQPYVLRDLIHTLLHHIKNHKNQPELSQISCKFFKNVLQKILPSLAPVVSQFFLIIVSRLKYVALQNCLVSHLCIDMLEFLIVEHKGLFISQIEKLDSVPKTAEFEKIAIVHQLVKYSERKVTFEDEIVQFLEFVNNMENLDECEDSINNLMSLLVRKKDELEDMCMKLRQTRGMSEDCEKSHLHKLISTLITLSCSANKKVSTESARCLGEIGPTDLATLILQPEKPILDATWTPWELVLGYALSLLSKYLVDADVAVIRVASLALFQILGTREGRKVAESQNDFGFGSINYSFFTPFCGIKVRDSKFKLTVNGDYLMQVIRDDELWIPDHESHKDWITKLLCTFLECFEETEFFSSLIGVGKLKIEFCEQILPLIIYSILFLNNFSFTTAISTQIGIFFDKHWDITINNQKSINVATNKSSVQIMLNVIHFIRLQGSARKKEIKNFKLDYLKAAKAAHFCTAHFTALLYAELWCQEKIKQSPNDYALSTCSFTKLDLIYDKVSLVTGNALQDILRQAYKSVGENDALLGCGTSHLLNPSSRVEHYKELGRWDQVTKYYETEVSLGRNQIVPQLVDGLKNANLYQLSLFCSKATEEANYECMWRLGQWSYNVTDVDHTSYDKSKFCALKALHEKDEFVFKQSLDEGRSCVVKDFMVISMESIKNFYNMLGKLQCLKEIEEFEAAMEEDEIKDLLFKWKIQDDIVYNGYQYVEPVQAQRILLLTNWLKTHSPAPAMKDMVADTILGYAQCARIEGNSNVAFRILEHLRLLNLENVDAKIQLEEAQLCWSIQDVITANCILRQLCASENVNPRLHALALKMRGTWMVESSSENRQTIIENYFMKSLDLIKGNGRTDSDDKCIIDTWHQLAKFADHEYQEVRSHIMSDVFQKKKQNVIKTKDMVNRIDFKNTSKDLQRAVTIKKKFSCIDEIEIHNIETDKNNLLILALKYYLRNLIATDDHNITVFRLFSLLLENRSNEIIKGILEKDILKVPSYKFISILPQIIPHISNTANDLFTQAVNNLIERCARDHPYHTLPLIMSLALSHKDREYSKSNAVVNDERAQSARAILTKLQTNEKLSSLIDKMEFLSEAIIELAYYTNNTNSNKCKVPRKAKILQIRNYDNVLLPTYSLPVNKSCDYNNIVGIGSFGDVYFNVGGINAPKRITCHGTDGSVRTQLVKGQDDLRQDAVMQQVFTIMNSLLGMNKQTKNLRIRTYKIVALSMRSGILEWVDNTMPILEYLTGNDGAHQKFRPEDSSPTKCRTDFRNSAASKSNEQRLRCFNKICENIKPVFHKFFETNFPQPTVWYERRRTYTHSVAVSSMCGYILGIGDRHLNNILIDKYTAEVVHIDFGIAFEQGRVLPTPETVPFRLTRDIVDGMGVSGVEGVFRRSCEKTVEVLRLHYQTIITILEVLLYDPLYDWTVSTAEANKRQKDEQEDNHLNGSINSDEDVSRNVNESAERALLRLRSKLQGSESGKSTTVEHQVGTLIQQAVDPSNLSRLFCGWAPYL